MALNWAGERRVMAVPYIWFSATSRARPDGACIAAVLLLRPLSIGTASAAGATASPRARTKVLRALRVTVGSFRPDRLQVRSTAQQTGRGIQRGIGPVSERQRGPAHRGYRSPKPMLGTTPPVRPPSTCA